MQIRTGKLLVGMVGVLLATSLSAAEFCVTNSAELQAALTTAAGNGQNDVIRIAEGTYNIPVQGFLYFGLNEDHDLTLIGGYSEFFGNPCGQILVENPWRTQLNGGGNYRVMTIRPGDHSNITVRGLTFRGGNISGGASLGGGLVILRPDQPGNGYTGKLHIQGNVFAHNEAASGAGLGVLLWAPQSGAQPLSLVNNLFFSNHVRNGFGGAARLEWSTDTAGQPGALFVVNNTVVNNTHGLQQNAAGGMVVLGIDIPEKVIANNHLWGNQDMDLLVGTSGQGYSLIHNNMGTYSGVEPETAQNNISVAPVYEPCPFPPQICQFVPWLVPRANSRLVDAGFHPESGAGWSLPEYDLRGEPRIDKAGKRVDIGAFESHERLFIDRFEQ